MVALPAENHTSLVQCSPANNHPGAETRRVEMADGRRDGRFSTVQWLHDRRAERRACHIPTVIVTAYGETGAIILNISEGGLELRFDSIMTMRPGERIGVRQDILGEVRCTVRWGLHPRYGVRFDQSGGTPPGAQRLYDSLFNQSADTSDNT